MRAGPFPRRAPVAAEPGRDAGRQGEVDHGEIIDPAERPRQARAQARPEQREGGQSREPRDPRAAAPDWRRPRAPRAARRPARSSAPPCARERRRKAAAGAGSTARVPPAGPVPRRRRSGNGARLRRARPAAGARGPRRRRRRRTSAPAAAIRAGIRKSSRTASGRQRGDRETAGGVDRPVGAQAHAQPTLGLLQARLAVPEEGLRRRPSALGLQTQTPARGARTRRPDGLGEPADRARVEARVRVGEDDHLGARGGHEVVQDGGLAAPRGELDDAAGGAEARPRRPGRAVGAAVAADGDRVLPRILLREQVCDARRR